MAVKKKTKAKTAGPAKAGKKRVLKKTAAKKSTAKKAPAKKMPAKKAPAKKAEDAPAKATESASAPPVEKAAAKAKAEPAGRLRLTLIKSVHGRLAAHRACAFGLGLRRRHQSVEIEDTPCTRGMINRIRYMLEVEGQ